MRRLKKIFLLLIIVASGLLSGCSTSIKREESITAVGSSAMQPLIELASEEFSKNHPDKIINVQGGGSGTGLSQVQSGAVEIGNSDLFAEEKKGIDAKKLVDTKVAVVGIAPIVNKEARVKNVSMQQLQQIFLGKIKNWREIGGADLPVVVLNRAFGSGTRTTFDNFVLQKKKSVISQEQDSSGMVRQIVRVTPGAVSYLAFSYLTHNLQILSVDGIKPTEDAVIRNKWKIWAYEHIYTKGQPKGLTKKFINYLKDNPEFVKKLKFIPVNEMKFERDAQGNVTPKQ